MTLARFNRPSRIGLRLFAFNLVVVFVPVLGVLYLDVYEARLRQSQEAGLVQQARVLAAALGGAALDSESIAATFARLERRSDARFRVYDTTGALVADSARQAAGTALDERARYPGEDTSVRRRRLYRVGVWLVGLRARLESALRRSTEHPITTPATTGTPPEVRAALGGKYGAATRETPGQRSMTFFSAVPVRKDGAVIGVVVASQSTMKILTALYAVRLRIFAIVIGSLFAAALLTALAAGTIVRPLTKLRRRAAEIAGRRGAMPSVFPGATRKDEIGDLARALGELSRRTNDHIDLLQTFSADVSHELKNPLASIRTAAEMMADAESPEERRRFHDLMVRDVERLERLVSGLRDVARVEGQIEADVTEPIELNALLSDLAAAADATAADGRHVKLDRSHTPVRAIASQERLAQVFENLLANAVSFTPPGTTVAVRVAQKNGRAVVSVDDDGPGVPDAHLERIFNRFFSYRPGENRREHVGLGLAIAKQIVESYGGTIAAENRQPRGARFTVTLPIEPR
jgi:two-component system, OmpR family, sensor histidine kinase ChvG